MAITHSWRLDSEKYVYLFPPQRLTTSTIPSNTEYSVNDFLDYGFLSRTPLTDYYAKLVADKAAAEFGRDAIEIDGTEVVFEKYQKAFNIMMSKINMSSSEPGYTQKMGDKEDTFVWVGASNYDLLSADVYFNVDASNCSDLRGIGIKEIKYIGSIPDNIYSTGNINNDASPQPINNAPSMYLQGENYSITHNNQKVEIQIESGIPGFTDVYGIFMDEDTSNDDSLLPENIFFIKNGKIGVKGEQGEVGPQGPSVTITDDAIEDLESIKYLNGKITELTSTVTTLSNSFKSIMGENLDDYLSQITTLRNEIKRLTGRVEQCEKDIEKIDTSTNNVPTGGNITVYSLRENALKLQNKWDSDTYGPDTSVADNHNFNSDSKEPQTLYLLGYYPKETGSENVTRLFAIPNIGIQHDKVIIKGSITTDKVYAKDGFYQDDNNNLVENTSFTIYNENND